MNAATQFDRTSTPTTTTTPRNSEYRRTDWPVACCALGLFLICVSLILLGGCGNQGSMMPNPDPGLRAKNAPDFIADAAKRHPYKSDAERAGAANGRAQYNYSADTIEIVNFSDQDWQDIEVWVNAAYVVHLARVERGAPRTKRIDFLMLRDDKGRQFPTDNDSPVRRINKVEILRDGKMYELKAALAE